MGKISLMREKGRGHASPAPVSYAARPLISPASGDYTDLDPVTVTITTVEAGGTTYYVTDGSTPTETSTQYTVPFEVSPPVGEGADISVRARTFHATKSPSDISGALYHFDEPVTPPVGSWDTRKMRDLPTDGVFSTWAGPTSGNTYYMAVGGSGTGTEASPFGTIAAAMAVMVPGDTLLLRGGTYWLSAFSWTLAGTAENRITIASYPGEIAYISFYQQEFIDGGGWTAVVGGAPDEYVSDNTFSGTGSISGWFADSMVPIQQVPVAQLEAETEVSATPTTTNWYPGPCCYHNSTTGKIHIRLSHTTLDFLETTDRWNLGGDYNYTGETDPNLIPLYMGVRTTSGFMSLAHYVTLRDVVVLGGGGDQSIRLLNLTGVTLDNVWNYPGASRGIYAQGCTGLTIQNSKLRGQCSPWTNRVGIKQQGNAPYNVIINECPDTLIDRNEITDGHDLLRMAGVAAGDYTVSRNLLENGNDDVLYMPGKNPSGIKQIYLNILRGGVSYFPTTGGGVGVTETDPDAGVYIYRNLIDMRRGCFGRPPTSATTEMALYYDARTNPGEVGSAFMSHNSPYERMDIHLYHNTFLVPSSPGAYHYRGLGSGLLNSETECFNNIWIQNEGSIQEGLRDPVTQNTVMTVAGYERGNNIAWRMASPPFTGAVATEIYEDPRFLNYTTDRFNPDEDLRLASNSPAIDGGRELDAAWPDVATLQAFGLDCGAIPHGYNGTVFGPESEL